jgi:hypothetical protein
MGIPANIIGIMGKMDTDALSFLDRAGITSSTERLAINSLVRNLKINNLWSSLLTFWPMVGGTSSSCLRNLKEDTNNLQFLGGGWTFDSTGAQPNGTTSYADTGVTINTETSLNDVSFGFYSKTNTTVTGFDMGIFTGSERFHIATTVSPFLLMTTYINRALAASDLNAPIPSTTGLLVSTRTANNVEAIYRNGSLLATGSAPSTIRPTGNCFLGARNQFGSASNWSNKKYAAAFIGSGLTAGQNATLYTIVQNFQTLLGRQEV